MNGIQHIEISSKRKVKFEFDLTRNITVIQGDSGSGKSTLYQLVADYNKQKDLSAVSISSTKACIAINELSQIKRINDSIVFIDEGADFVKSKEFANLIKKSDNYYVIFMRDELHELPYSVEEIYYIKTSGKYHTFVKMHKSNDEHVYSEKPSRKRFVFDTIIVEDTKSGYQFFKSIFDESKINVIPAGANSSIYGLILQNLDKKILVIADGAAFGSEMNRIMMLQKQKPENIKVCLPESFEWLILKSGLIKSSDLDDMLMNTSMYIESKEFFSWEEFFTKYLIQISSGTPFAYKKPKLNKNYLIEENTQKIIDEVRSVLNK